eukprot:364950-Chlamydomonas_euryale.AAC.5
MSYLQRTSGRAGARAAACARRLHSGPIPDSTRRGAAAAPSQAMTQPRLPSGAPWSHGKLTMDSGEPAHAPVVLRLSPDRGGSREPGFRDGTAGGRGLGRLLQPCRCWPHIPAVCAVQQRQPGNAHGAGRRARQEQHTRRLRSAKPTRACPDAA